MRVPIFQVDAFATRRFTGNPAAVLPLPHYPDDRVLQAIAAENNLAETAFIVAEGDHYALRWFTPTVEVPLCGHATLASAAVVMERLEPGRTSVGFRTRQHGTLTVARQGARYVMDFPAMASTPIEAPAGLAEALGTAVLETRVGNDMLLARVADAAIVRGLAPDMVALGRHDFFGIIVTAAGDAGYDVVSRFFAPKVGIAEDPVTGGAHCVIAPYWSARLGKDSLTAFQASKRGGEINCRLRGDRVELEGSCVFFLEGTAEYEEQP
jgi:PhzF family phenazine biosynthesis protein